jgi:CO/xanthine dehydrogenase Mo-binding subunit
VILNPIGAEGQVEGGVVMGIGEALLEGTVLTDEGRQVNAGLLDYKLQTCSDAPPITIEFVTAPDPSGGGPKGSKGVGEPPCVPTPGAVGNAIAAVIGTHVMQLPMTPDRVWSTSLGLDA